MKRIFIASVLFWALFLASSVGFAYGPGTKYPYPVCDKTPKELLVEINSLLRQQNSQLAFQITPSDINADDGYDLLGNPRHTEIYSLLSDDFSARARFKSNGGKSIVGALGYSVSESSSYGMKNEIIYSILLSNGEFSSETDKVSQAMPALLYSIGLNIEELKRLTYKMEQASRTGTAKFQEIIWCSKTERYIVFNFNIYNQMVEYSVMAYRVMTY